MKNRQLILHRLLSKSNTIMDDIVQLMMQIYSTNSAAVSKTTETENYRNVLIEQLKESQTTNSQL
jgi:hypothetical protein